MQDNIDMQHSIKLFLDLVASVDSGSILLVGESGSGKSILVENFLAVHSADHHNFEKRPPLDSELTFAAIFKKHHTAVIDFIDFKSPESQRIISILRVLRKEKKTIIITTYARPEQQLHLFTAVVYLKSNPGNRGWHIQCIDQTPLAVVGREWHPLRGAISTSEDSFHQQGVKKQGVSVTQAQSHFITRLHAGDKIVFKTGNIFCWEQGRGSCTRTARRMIASGYIRVDDSGCVVLTRAGLMFAEGMRKES